MIITEFEYDLSKPACLAADVRLLPGLLLPIKMILSPSAESPFNDTYIPER